MFWSSLEARLPGLCHRFVRTSVLHLSRLLIPALLLALAGAPARAQEEAPQEPPVAGTSTPETLKPEIAGEAEDPSESEPATPSPDEAGVPALRTFEVRPATSKINVDGMLDEAAWEDAVVIDLPYEWYPGDNITPPVRTESLVTFDEQTIYVAFRAYDPEPSEVRAHLMDRDEILLFIQDDHVGFNFDTFNDERSSYHFRVNPLGVQVDAIFSERSATEDYSWDAIWASAGRITDFGWVVEAAIPAKQLRFPRANGKSANGKGVDGTGTGNGQAVQTWGYEAFRSYPRSVRHRISSRYTDRAKDCLLCQENKITGFYGLATGRNLELTPTLTGIRSEARDAYPDGDFQTTQEDLEPGATLRWGITPNTSLSATVNPDFSQVEADVAQLDINTRFALFFPEKRPFFLEGAELFLTPFDAVFTRTVADPEWGVKFSAREGKNTFATFLAEDEINNITFAGNQGSRRTTLEDGVRSGVVRYSREVGKYSSVGVLYTGREGDDYHNHVGGIDGFLRFTPSDTIRVQYLRSDTEYPGAVAERFGQPDDPFGGDAFTVRYNHFDDRWRAAVRYDDIDPGFRTDSGFMPRVDVRTGEASYEYYFYGEADDWYSQIVVGGSGLRTEDHNGTLTNETVEAYGIYQGPYQSTVRVQVFDSKELLAGQTFDLFRHRYRVQANPLKNVRATFNLWLGDELDVVNGRKGEGLLWSPNVLMRLGRNFTMELDYVRQELDVEGGRLFGADLAQGKFIYNFNVRTFVRAIIQYTGIERDTDLYTVAVSPMDRELFSQLLFSYKINPQTVLFLGYTDTRYGTDDVSLTQTDRTLFLKVGYAFLF